MLLRHKSTINAWKIFRRLRVWMEPKNFIHTSKPQIPSVEPRKRRLGIRTIPCIFWWREKNQETLMCFFFWSFLCLEEGKTFGKIPAKSKTQKNVVFSKSEECLGLFIVLARTSRIRLILTPLKRSWIHVSKKVWNLKIQRSDQKLWLSQVSDSSIDASSQFLWYLSRSNSDFDP